MKKLVTFFAIILTALTLKLVFAGNLKSIDPLSASKLQNEKKATIIDVREAEETKEGVAKGAIILPLSLMNEKREEWEKIVSTLPKGQTLIVYCRSGKRAGVVGVELSKKGHEVFNMGGLESWQKAGLPIEHK